MNCLLKVKNLKLNNSLVFIKQSYFKVSKDIRLNSTHYVIMKILNKTELQQIAVNNSSDTDFTDIDKKMCCREVLFFSFWLLIQCYHQTIHYVLETIV